MAYKSNDNETLMTLFDEEGNTVFEDEVIENQDMNTVFSGDEELLINPEESTKHLDIGSTFVSKYVIKKVLGQGGLGIAYLAEESSSHNQIVIKEFFPHKNVIRSGNSEVSLAINATEKSHREYELKKQVFEEEARNLVSVNRTQHKNVVGFTTLFKNVNNTVYYAMPYSEGEELKSYLDRKEEEGKKLSQQDIMKIVLPVLDGLTHIHKYNVYHKDIKPANIFMRKNDEPMLIDFGASVTSANLLTRAYAPIEQVNKQIEDYGPYTDIYATGVMMYRMITGRFPPRAQDRAQALSKGLVDPYITLVKNKEIKGFEAHFLQAIDHSLKFSYNDRPETAQLFEEELTGDLKRKRRNKIITWILFTSMLSFIIGWIAYDSLRKKTFELTILEKVTEDIDIYIDGQPKEADRLSVNGYPIYTLNAREVNNYKVRKKGFMTRSKDYNISGEEDENIEKDILFVPDSVEFMVIVKDNKENKNFKANIFVNEEYIGREQEKKLKYWFDRDKGLTQEFKIEAKAKNYLSSNVEKLTYKDLMKKNEIILTLIQKEGSIKFIGPHGFHIKIDGKLQKKNNNNKKYKIPCTIDGLSVGDHQIFLYHDQGLEYNLTIRNRVVVFNVSKYEPIDFNLNLEHLEEIEVDKKAEVSEEYIKVEKEERRKKEAIQKWEAVQKVDKKYRYKALNDYISNYPKSPKIQEAIKELKEAKKKENEAKQKGLNQSKEILSIVKLPKLVNVKGLKVAQTEVTYDELVRYLNSRKLSIKKLKEYFYCSGKYIAKYITKELSDNGEYHYFVAKENMQYPVTYISWKGANAYAKWLSTKSVNSYRLLTLEEWKTVSGIGFNPDTIDTYAVHSKNSLGLNPVKNKLATASGVYDIFGNVYEWSEDKSSIYERITLGGSFESNKSLMSPDEYFMMNENKTKNSDIGFRVIKVN